MRFSFFRFCSIATLLFAGSGGCGSNTATLPTTDTGGETATVPVNAGWCTAAGLLGCNGFDVCGVCVPAPSGEAVRTADTKEYKGTGPVDVSCFETGAVAPAGTSQKVKIKGFVKIFANGPDSKNVKIDVYEEILDDKGLPTGKIGPTPIATGSSDAAFGTLEDKITKKGVETIRVLYGYEVDGVPTEKPLVIKTSGKTADDGWFELYDYNQAVRNDAVKAGVYDGLNVRALGNDDYASILKAAYSRPPEGGQSAIAGEVHDCGDVRISNATVEISPKSSLGLFYLSEVEDDPLPKSSLSSTARLGLYAVGGLTPGIYSVSSLAKVGGVTKTLGNYRVQTFPNAVSVYTFRGLRPWQIKK